MPQLLEKGTYYKKMSEWLEQHPEATLKALKKEFYFSPGTMKHYLRRWREYYRHKALKEDLIFVYVLMKEKTKRKNVFSIAEEQKLLELEKKVDLYMQELGIVRKKVDPLASLNLKREKVM